MQFLTESVAVKQWLLIMMIIMSGYATGSIAAKLAIALGF